MISDTLPSGSLPEARQSTAPPLITRSLRTNFSWTLSGNIIYGGCQWLMLVLIARLGDPQMVGAFALAQAITTPIVVFGNLQLRIVQATDATERFQFGHYLALRYLTIAAALAAIIACMLLGGYSAESQAVILAVALAKCTESLSDIYFGLLQHHEEMGRIARSMIIKGLLSVLAMGCGLYLTHRLAVATLSMMLVWLLVLTAYDLRAPRFCALHSGRPVWDRLALARLARLAFPLGVNMLLLSLNANLPRYFMEHFRGTRSLGLFSALTAIQSGGMLVIMALGNAAMPQLARSYRDSDWLSFRNTVVLFLGISAGLGVVTVLPVLLAGDRLITLAFGPEYAGQNQTFIWLALAAAVSYITSVFGYAATAARRINFQPLASGIVAALTALGCYKAVPLHGALGAAITVCVATAAGLVFFLASFVAMAGDLKKRPVSTRTNQRMPAAWADDAAVSL
jgi:O-antigen/teichoic acid export membrane protein